MSHFYGIASGCAKTKVTRRGSKNSGLRTIAASWSGAIQVETWHDVYDGRDKFCVRLIDWPSKTVRAVLAQGCLDEQAPRVVYNLAADKAA
jgi:hypothetical protein